jgi:hypothetical protein
MVLEDSPTSENPGKQASSLRFQLFSFKTMSSYRRRHFPTLALSATVGWLASSLAIQAHAADMSLGNSGVRFNRDTTLETNFVESHGAYQSTFGVINLDTNEKTPLLVETKPADAPASIFNPSSKVSDVETTNDFLGTAQGTVANPSATYNFKANTNYVFYLESNYNGRPTGTVYSSDVMNSNKERQVSFSGDPANFCQGSGVSLAWDDTGADLVRNRDQQDRDFDDFIVRLRDTACPIGGGDTPGAAALAPPESVAPTVGQLPPGGGAPIAAAGPGAGSLTLPLGLLGAGAIAGIAVAAGGGDDDDDNNGATGEPIPEPFTIVGSGAAVGFAALMRRRARSRKKQ